MHLCHPAAQCTRIRGLRQLYQPLPVEAKRIARTRLRYAGSLAAMLPWLQDEIEEIDEVFGGDPFPYGVEANRPTLEALVQYMHEQHFIAEPMQIEKLFVPLPGAHGT